MNDAREELRQYLIAWNNRFPYDRAYRRKYGVGFCSPEHRALNPVDMFLDILEDEIFADSMKYWEERKKDEELLAQGIWLKEQPISKELEESLYKKIDISLINKSK